MGRLEALPLDRVVRVEAQEHAAACGHDWLGLLAPTEAAQNWGLGVTPVIHLQVVVGTLGLGLNVHLQEGLGHVSRTVSLECSRGRCGGQQVAPNSGLLTPVHRVWGSGPGWWMAVRGDPGSG